MSTSNLRRHRRATGSNSPKGSTHVKAGQDENGNTIYYNATSGRRNVRPVRVAHKVYVWLPNYVFGSFRKPQERGSLKAELVLKEADAARRIRAKKQTQSV